MRISDRILKEIIAKADANNSTYISICAVNDGLNGLSADTSRIELPTELVEKIVADDKYTFTIRTKHGEFEFSGEELKKLLNSESASEDKNAITLRDGGSVLFYPSGHVQSEAEVETVGTRQLAYNVCRELPNGVRVLGVRTRGLWGSIWSRKGRTSSPAFVPTFLKGIFHWFFITPFVPRRPVTMHVEDLTDRVRTWSRLTRLEFNRELEKWYNGRE